MRFFVCPITEIGFRSLNANFFYLPFSWRVSHDTKAHTGVYPRLKRRSRKTRLYHRQLPHSFDVLKQRANNNQQPETTHLHFPRKYLKYQRVWYSGFSRTGVLGEPNICNTNPSYPAGECVCIVLLTSSFSPGDSPFSIRKRRLYSTPLLSGCCI